MNVERFPKFLKDASVYDDTWKFWAETWKQLMRRTDQNMLWETPWFGAGIPGGNPDRDGNPIFSAVCQSTGIGIRVIQFEREATDDIELDWWIGYSCENAGDPGAIRELVISCILTDNTLRTIRSWMSSWIKRGQVEERSPEDNLWRESASLADPVEWPSRGKQPPLRSKDHIFT